MVGAHTKSKQNFVTAPLRFGTRREEEELASRAYKLAPRLFELHDVCGPSRGRAALGTATHA
jgi:hypothetical protein